MTVTVTKHDRFKKLLVDGPGWVGLDMRAALVRANAWTPAAADGFVASAISAGAVELTVSGYARVTLAGQTTTLDDANTRATGDANDVSFSGPPATGGIYDTLIVFHHVTNDSDSTLALTYALGGTFTTNGAAITFTLDAVGLFTLT